MTRIGKFGVALAALVIVVGAVQPVEAVCANVRLFSSFNSATGYYSALLSDADWDYYYGGNPAGSDIGGTVSSALTGTFWHLGNGDPALLAGNDNGSFAALYGFIYTSIGYNSAIDSKWDADAGIDGCIDTPVGGPADKCMGIFLMDKDEDGATVFALLTSPADAGQNYNFDQAGGAPIVLAPLPAISITDSQQGGDDSVIITVQGPTDAELEATGGYYLNMTDECAAKADINPIMGYRVYECVLPSGSPPPVPGDACWTLADEAVVETGAPSTNTVLCGDAPPDGADDVYMSYKLILDGGFEVDLQAGGSMDTTSSRVECGPNLAEDPQDRIRIRKDGLRQRPTTRRSR